MPVPAMISILFILIAVLFGFSYTAEMPVWQYPLIAGVAAIIICMIIGYNWHPLYLSSTAWMIIIGIYIMVASVAPVWILLQPRDYLSSFLFVLYDDRRCDRHHRSASVLRYAGLLRVYRRSLLQERFWERFPALFITMPAERSPISFTCRFRHHRKAAQQRKDARPIAYGGMLLIECALAIISLCAEPISGAIMKRAPPLRRLSYSPQVSPQMLDAIPFLNGTAEVTYLC